MDYMNDLHEMCETLSKELGEANMKVKSSGGKLSGSDLDYIDKLTHAIKSIKTTIAMEEADDGYSEMYPYVYSYDNNGDMGGMNRNSYAMGRGRGSNARRDSMGRYSSRGYSRDYSRRGYSRDNSDMISELQDIMEDAPDERSRQEIQKLITKMQSM